MKIKFLILLLFSLKLAFTLEDLTISKGVYEVYSNDPKLKNLWAILKI